MTWDERFSVGVGTLDEQHTVLFGILNDLYDAMKKGQAHAANRPPAAQAGQLYTPAFLFPKRRRWRPPAFPGLAAHRVLHRDLIQQVEKLDARFERNDIMLSVDLFNFLRDWLTNHIQKTDKEYGPWLIEHGVH